MAVVGKHYTRINGGAYVASNDIPQHLVEFIDSLTRRIDVRPGCVRLLVVVEVKVEILRVRPVQAHEMSGTF